MKVYLDNAATTYTDKIVMDAMIPYFCEQYGNGSSQHCYGREALKAIDIAREQVAKALNCSPSEIYFTSGGTESDNWAINGFANANKNKGNHIITSCIEHPAVIQTCKALEKNGFEVTYLPVDNQGLISIADLENAIKDSTILISIMTINNEIGTIQPIAKIGEIAKQKKITFHTDAVQAIGTINMDVKAMNIDLLSLTAHKFYGPKGVGVLYKRNGVKIGKLLNGGGQERNLRASTLNTPAIVGLGKAIELAIANMQQNNDHIMKLRDYFVEKVTQNIEDIYYNGAKDNKFRTPNNANFSFEFIEGESILMLLDMAGIAVSSGSACSSGSLEPSYVLLSIGLPIEIAHGSIRFSFGKSNTIKEVDYTVEKLIQAVAKLREMSPLFLKKEGELSYV